METLRGAELELIELQGGKLLPGIPLPERKIFVAFGDGDAPDNSGDVYRRWANDDEYLIAVVDGLNRPEGSEFAKQALDSKYIQTFSYKPNEPLYVAPCTVIKASDGQTNVVTVYSFGPK